MPEKPTLKTIARLTGLAVPTVSRALAGAADISADTKKKVREVASLIGYVPNRAGVRLRTGRTQVVSLVLSTRGGIMDLTAQLIASIAAGLRDTGYHLTITPYSPDEDKMRPIRYIVETGAADAVILNKIEPGDPRIEYLLHSKFPFASHGRSNRAAEHAYFDFDNRAFGRIAVDRLVAMGRRKLLLIAPPSAESYAGEMIGGASEAAREFGATLSIAPKVSIDSSMDDIEAVAADLVGGGTIADGLISGSPAATMAAVAGFERHGGEVGRTFDVVSKDSASLLRLFRARIISFDEDVAFAGEFLAKAAIHAVAHRGDAPMQHLDGPARDAMTK